MPPEPRPYRFRGASRVILPAVLIWLGLVGGAAYLLYERLTWVEKYDRAVLEEWFKELRPFRKNLSTVVDEYLANPTAEKREEIEAQLEAMAEPMRTYTGMLPLFPEIFSITILFSDPHRESIVWSSPVPVPRLLGDHQQIRTETFLEIRRSDGETALVQCRYRLHAFAATELQERRRLLMTLIIGGVVLIGIALAAVSVWLFLRRERLREIAQLENDRALEHAENLALAEQLRAEEEELAKEELEKQLLEQKLKVAENERRVSEAENTALKMRSELFAGIGIMAGSYAHNIKNLLVRPNDLLARCLEGNTMSSDQTGMLEEVRTTLGTVTERLQQILKTVRRDPAKTEMTRIDLNALLHDTQQTWAMMAKDKWKMMVEAEIAPEPIWIRGDFSHLQQAIENLLFNARDATFEMRNIVRENARNVTDPARRKTALIEAASWKGQVRLRLRRDGNYAVLEVKDNGIGMTKEVQTQCLQTHFSTKRDNAIFEGFSAGMGLGLSFVVVVLEHHGANLEIESEPHHGALFRIRFPLDPAETVPTDMVSPQ